MNDFDDLFNQFFGGERFRKPRQSKLPNGIQKMKDLIDKLNKNFDGSMNNIDENKLGEPTSVRTFERDGVVFEESRWETEYGTIVRMVVKSDIEFTPEFFKRNNLPFGEVEDVVELSLEEQLENAVKEERYEDAAKIRDEIKTINEKNKKDENPENKGGSEGDGWNF